MTEENVVYGPFFGMVGATAAMTLCALGAEYGTAKAGAAISAAGSRKPDAIMRTLLPVVMAGIIAIYGLVAAVLIANDLRSSEEGYTLYRGYLHFGAGISVGMSGLASGYAIGIAGAAGVRGTVHQPSLFVGMILILIFAEVLGLYGLIVALILVSKN